MSYLYDKIANIATDKRWTIQDRPREFAKRPLFVMHLKRPIRRDIGSQIRAKVPPRPGELPIGRDLPSPPAHSKLNI